MRNVCLYFFVVAVLTATAQPTVARLQFYKAWEAEYLTDHSDKDFAALVKKPANRCFVCHVGKKRTHRNDYGKLMEEALDGKKNVRDKDKILAAIKAAGEKHVDPNDDSSETFGERIAAGKFPAGDLEDLKKEPAE